MAAEAFATVLGGDLHADQAEACLAVAAAEGGHVPGGRAGELGAVGSGQEAESRQVEAD